MLLCNNPLAYLRNTATIITLLAIIGIMEYLFILYVYSGAMVQTQMTIPNSKITGVKIISFYEEEPNNQPQEVYTWISKAPPTDPERVIHLQQEPEPQVRPEFDNFAEGPPAAEDNGPEEMAKVEDRDGSTTASARGISQYAGDRKMQEATTVHPMNESSHTLKDKAIVAAELLHIVEGVHSSEVQTPSQVVPEQTSSQNNTDQTLAPEHTKSPQATANHNKVQRSPQATTNMPDKEAANKTCVDPPVFTQEVLVELDETRPYRRLSPEEVKGGNIMFTLRTTSSYHKKRLPLLMETWMTTMDAHNIFVVTDSWDQEMVDQLRKLGVRYVVADGCSNDYVDLCCKAGAEMELMFEPGNEIYDWLCHIDDDMYVIMNSLIKTLSKFDPKTEPVYFGRSGKEWTKPKTVKSGAKLGCVGQAYHFALGGMYCLNRIMVEKARPYLVGGQNFSNSCASTLEPEDVTVGFIVGIVLNHTLSGTHLINTHGLRLQYEVFPDELMSQIAISYGYGCCNWSAEPYNAVFVPQAVFSFEEDPSQFKSLLCYFRPNTPWCIPRREMAEKKRVERAKIRARAREHQRKRMQPQRTNIAGDRTIVYTKNGTTYHKTIRNGLKLPQQLQNKTTEYNHL